VSELEVVRAGTVPYEEAWERQRALHAARVADEGPDTLLLLEHPSVYTAGKRTEPHERPQDGTPVVDVDRGGKITWHGPGQLVGYPIVALPDPVDVVAYVRRLEARSSRSAPASGVEPAGRGAQRRLGCPRTPSGRAAGSAPSARSPRSGSGWPAA
jgi:lipoyl(octanoyl) transferase